MRKPDRTKFPAVAALLLTSDLRLLVRHERARLPRTALTTLIRAKQSSAWPPRDDCYHE